MRSLHYSLPAMTFSKEECRQIHVRQALHTMRSLQYPLPAMTFSKEECRQILKPVLDVSLPNMRICRNYPGAAVHGASDVEGLEIDDLYTYQGISEIVILQEHINASIIIGELIRASAEMAKNKIGIGKNLFEIDYIK